MPINVRAHDLKPDVSESAAHNMVANAMVDFFDSILFGKSQALITDVNASKAVVQGFVEAMELEGYA
jgi:hypothetical protein